MNSLQIPSLKACSVLLDGLRRWGFLSCSPACARASGCSAQHRAGRRRWFQSICACRHSVADAPLPGGASTRGRVSSGAALLSRGVEVKRAGPLLQERNAKYEHDRKPHLHRMSRKFSATAKPNRQAHQISSSTAGMENRFIAGMSHARKHATVRNAGSGSRLLEISHR